MRWMVDLAAALALAAAVAAGLYIASQRSAEQSRIELAAGELRRLDLEIKYRAATGGVPVNVWGWPTEVDPAWFGAAPPTNPLLQGDRPWLEIAGPDEGGLLHPRVRVAYDEETASFWYNPSTGAVRARIAARVSDSATTRLYNRVNEASLRDIFQTEEPPPDAGRARASRAQPQEVADKDR